ncbi:HEAT repeat domain-containing protein [Paraglaciecola hydrolytica]|uniref:HEAT repeat domain-containing protein n=1 Tax=Paraglaciecola hydrolytica TaxID=1799789 RepID=A0A136A3A5_9ALTE|nr:HEAT repeat domain-containing protein [Paraglaciecola hydrolytica]KXI29610.1 hypothetical protein AX660_06040 [Paraglaciecola hydrolytica]
MELRLVYIVSIFCAGFAVGYFVNEQDEFNGDTVADATLTVPHQAAPTLQKVNPFQLLSSQQNELGEQANPNNSTFKTDNTALSWQENNNLNSPEQNELLNAKLAQIGYLVKDNELDKLASGLGDSSAQVRKQTILGLSDLNSADALQVVGQVLFSDPSAENRMLAVGVLEKHQHLAFVTHFLKHAMQNDTDAQVRQFAATVLGQQ